MSTKLKLQLLAVFSAVSATIAASADRWALLPAPECTPTAGDARSILQHAADVTGLRAARGRVLHSHGYDVVSFDFQSDRPYPPYLSAMSTFDMWFQPQTGVERAQTRMFVASNDYPSPATLSDANVAFAVRDTTLTPATFLRGTLDESRYLNVWAMLDDWLAATDVRVVEQCNYRDFPRTVLSRVGSRGPERLFVDPKSGFPVKVDRQEPHYLWGQVHVEYVYTTWQRMGDATLPASYRLVEGANQIERIVGPTSLAPLDSAPRLTLPASQPMPLELPAYLIAAAPDTIRVDAKTFLLKNRGYTETVTLRRDTVYVFDATQSETRAQQDSAWIGRLFPGKHPIVVVVTDLAYPHVAGVRYWVAQGATIVSHTSSKEFLTKVVEHRWTAAPDLLESRRKTARFRFRPVTDSLRLAGGDLLAFGLGGIGSENAVGVFARDGAFLWASDYIQNLRESTSYLDEVYTAVHRLGLSPTMVAAEHIPLTKWESLLGLVTQSGATRGR
jgi:hypothetical protein